MRVETLSADKITENNQSLTTAMRASAGAPEEAATLFDEFSQILDKIASHVSTKGVNSSNTGWVEQALNSLKPAAAAPRDVRSEVRPDASKVELKDSTVTDLELNDESRAEDHRSKQEGEGVEQSAVNAHAQETQTNKEAVATVAAQVAKSSTQTPSAAPAGATPGASTTEQPAQTAEGAPFDQELMADGQPIVTQANNKLEKSTQHAAKVTASANNATTPATTQAEIPATELPAAAEGSELESLLLQISQRVGLSGKASTTPTGPDSAKNRLTEFFTAQALMQGGVTEHMNESISAAVTKQALSALSRGGAVANDVSSQRSQVGGVVDSSAMRTAQAERNAESKSSRAIPRPLQQRMMEKVESVLKEVAQSRDGKTISLRLDPPNFGSLKIDLSLREGTMHARIVADVPAVAQMLRERAFEPQESLRKIGVDVDKVTVAVNGEQGESASFADHAGEFKQQHEQLPFSSEAAFKGAPTVGSEGTSIREVVTSIDDHWVA